MNWNKGYTSACYMTVVDRLTWRDTQRIEITGGSVSRTDTGLRESAQVDCVRYDQSAERWIRIWMDVTQEGSSEHVPVFTGLAASPDRDINGRLETSQVICYSVLQPAKDIPLKRGWYAPAGANGANLAAQLLAVTPAPKVVEEGSPLLSSTYIAESGETHLTMAQKIISAIGWRLRIEGDGTIHICPQAAGVSAAFDSLEYDAIEPKVKVTYDWFSAPNMFRAIMNGVSAVAEDDSPDSIFSTIRRGREIWKEESNCQLNDTESLVEYAQRRLKEEQDVAYIAAYDRRYHPAVTVSDLVRLNYPEQDLVGVFMVKKQNIDLKRGGRTSETGERYGNF